MRKNKTKRLDYFLFHGFPVRSILDGDGVGLQPHERLQSVQRHGRLPPHEVAPHQGLDLDQRPESSKRSPSLTGWIQKPNVRLRSRIFSKKKDFAPEKNKNVMVEQLRIRLRGLCQAT